MRNPSNAADGFRKSSTHPTAGARLPGGLAGCYESSLMPEPSHQQAEPTRRDVLRVATGAAGAAAVVGAVGAAVYMVPLLDAPDAATPTVAGTVDVDLVPLQAGQQIMVFWRSWPIFVAHR